MENLHLSIYLIGFLLVPICIMAFISPKSILLAMITCADALCTGLPVAIFPLVAEDPIILGALVAAKPLGQALAIPLVDRFTRQREIQTMKLGLLLQSAGLVLQAFTPSLGAWFAARAAQGVASGLILCANTVTDEDPNGKTSNFSPQSRVHGTFLGAIVGIPFGGICFSTESFLPFLFLALVDLILLTAVHFNVDMTSTPSLAPSSYRSYHFLHLLTTPMIWRPLRLIFLMAMYSAALQAMIFKVLEEEPQVLLCS